MGLARYFCDTASAERVQTFLSPRIDKLGGGPRNLAKTLERIRLCAALVDAQGESTRAFFRAKPEQGLLSRGRVGVR